MYFVGRFVVFLGMYVLRLVLPHLIGAAILPSSDSEKLLPAHFDSSLAQVNPLPAIAHHAATIEPQGPVLVSSSGSQL